MLRLQEALHLYEIYVVENQQIFQTSIFLYLVEPPPNKKNASFGKPCSICIILLYTSYFVKFPSTIRYYKMFLMKNFNLRLILLIYLFIGTKVRFF